MAIATTGKRESKIGRIGRTLREREREECDQFSLSLWASPF
jgi:hypothetical protein